jgi:hypothetical protein
MSTSIDKMVGRDRGPNCSLVLSRKPCNDVSAFSINYNQSLQEKERGAPLLPDVVVSNGV